MLPLPTRPTVVPLTAYRWSPFDDTILVRGFDFTDVTTATMQVRSFRDQPGDPLIDLALTPLPAQGLSITVTGDASLIPTSALRILINETTIEQLLPFAQSGLEQAAPDVALVYAIHLAGPGFKKFRWFEGPFTISAGANFA